MFTNTTSTVVNTNSHSRENLRFDHLDETINYNILRRSAANRNHETERSALPQDHPLLNTFFAANEEQMLINNQLLMKNLKHQINMKTFENKRRSKTIDRDLNSFSTRNSNLYKSSTNLSKPDIFMQNNHVDT